MGKLIVLHFYNFLLHFYNFGLSRTGFSYCFGWHESESEVTQLGLTLWDPMDCSLPGSSIHGIFQATVLEWGAISFSRGSSQPRDWTRGLLHRRQTLYRLSHQGSPHIWGKSNCTDRWSYKGEKYLIAFSSNCDYSLMLLKNSSHFLKTWR